MKILNIDVYSDPIDGFIKIRFDAIGNKEEKKEPSSGRGSFEEIYALSQSILSEKNVIERLKTHPDALDEIGMGGIDLSESEKVKAMRDPIGADYFSPVELKIKMIRMQSHFNELSQKITIKEIFNNSCRRSEEKAFTPQIIPPLYFTLEDDGLKQCAPHDTSFQQHSVIYTLSTTPHIALSFMLCAANVIFKLKYESTYFNPLYNNGYSQAVLENDMTEFGDDHENEFMITLFKRLLALPIIPAYKYTMDALHKIGKPYIESRNTANQIGLTDLMQAKNCCTLLWNPLVETLLNPKILQMSKIQMLMKTAREYIHANQQAELDYLVKRIHLLAKEKLVESCLGKSTHIHGIYTLDNTLLDFIREAQFSVSTDECMRIINLDKNIAYKKYYAADNIGHRYFVLELKFLGELIGLEFTACDHGKIIFTKECSSRLFAQGLHFNLAYVKNLLRAQNHFFVTKTNKNNPFHNLPEELTTTILHYEDQEEACSQLTIGGF
jgi:hypothetical protein